MTTARNVTHYTTVAAVWDEKYELDREVRVSTTKSRIVFFFFYDRICNRRSIIIDELWSNCLSRMCTNVAFR